MKAVLQRVSRARLDANKKEHCHIGPGLVILAGFEQEESESDITWMATKIIGMRIFSDTNGKMNLSVKDVNGDILIVSQFTLHGSTKKGNRPSFIRSAPPEKAIRLYNLLIEELKTNYADDKIASGVFGAHMDIDMVCDGPVTILMDTKNKE